MVDAAQDLPASAWVDRHVELIAPGSPVLDVAAGRGRHSRLLRRCGLAVTAVDKDVAGLIDLRADAAVEIVAADLEDGSPWPFGARSFAGVVVTNYLWRPLLPRLVAAVAPGGALIYETFALGQERFGRPRNPDFLLRPGELLAAVAGRLRVVAYEDTRIDRPTPTMLQRIAAVREPHPMFD